MLSVKRIWHLLRDGHDPAFPETEAKMERIDRRLEELRELNGRRDEGKWTKPKSSS